MKKLILFIVLCAFSISFWGCPYKSEIPLDSKPQKEIGNKYLGKWGTSSDSYYEVSKKNNYVCGILNKELDSNGIEEISSRYEGFLSEVGEVTYLNLKEIGGDSDDSYYIYKVTLEGESIFLTGITPYIKEEFRDSEDMKSFFKKNQKISFFFMSPVEYKRVR